MPRKARHFKPDSVFSIGARGVDRQPIFLCEEDKKFFLACMDEALAETSMREVARCLMPNHFHWALITDQDPFDRVMRSVMTRHAVRFNKLHGRSGHLFENRHWSAACEDLSHIENTVAYIHMNPVRAMIVDHPSKWAWSSFADWTGKESRLDFGRISAITGLDAQQLRENHLAKIQAELSGTRQGFDAESLIADVASLLGLSVQRLRNGEKGDLITKAKRMLIARAKREGISIAALARSLGIDPESLYRVAIRTP